MGTWIWVAAAGVALLAGEFGLRRWLIRRSMSEVERRRIAGRKALGAFRYEADRRRRPGRSRQAKPFTTWDASVYALGENAAYGTGDMAAGGDSGSSGW